jgi:predicted peroxiredoxin
MPDAPASAPSVPRLVILLNSAATDAPDRLFIPFRYASTAAAMDLAVEMHLVNRSLAQFRRGGTTPELLALVRQAVELGVEIFACPLALKEQNMGIDDLIAEVSGVRGAASLLAAGFEPGARFLVF